MTIFVVLVALAFAGLQGWRWFVDATPGSNQPWMASYVDVTATPRFDFEAPTTISAKNVVLSFIVADSANSCQPSWGTHYSLAEADSTLDLDRRIARLQQQGGSAIVSFGGQANSDLASVCTAPDALQSAYESVVDRYDLNTVDLDIEGATLDDAASGERRAVAFAAIQKAHSAAGKPLAVWLTLPVSPSGLTPSGTAVVSQMLGAGVDIAGVNLMTMDFGGALATGQTMSAAAIAALTATHGQLHTLYSRDGTELGSKALWNKIGATPMIGQNDVSGEIFTIADAEALNAFAAKNDLARMSMWSLNRDATCGSNYPDLTQVSDSCSGIDQQGQRFADVLGKNFAGSPSAVSDAVTTSEPVASGEPGSTATPDDPTTSPYEIWDIAVAYAKDAKVVWHHNVYVAKYWTKGDLPDNPVLQATDTPWLLVGPVLPGETPEPIATLPTGTYPGWSGSAIYTQGDRITFSDGFYYEAKWWTQGDSPEAAAAGPDASPWLKLTNDQVREVLDQPANDQTPAATSSSTSTPRATPTPTPTPGR